MGFFNWSRKSAIPDAVYSVMNDDHVELYRIVGTLTDAVKQRCNSEHERDVQRLQVVGIIKNLISKAAEHFNREEQLMESYRYPEAKAHRSEHLMLLRTVETYLSRLTAEGRLISEDTARHLKNWLTNHIRTTDRQLDRFLIATAKKAGSAEKAKLAQDIPSWTPEHSFLWAAFNDAVSHETVHDNRKKNDAIHEMEQRQRRERERLDRMSGRSRSAEQSRQMRAVYFE